MAKQDSIIPVIGKLGKIIGYRRNGKYFFRSAPEHVHQTRATRRASKRFGTYSRKSRVIRHAFYPELDVRCDSTHINRLNKILINAAGNYEIIKGFRFNEAAGIDRFFPLTPWLSGMGTLHIPSQDISFHQFRSLEIKAIAVRIDFNTGQVTGTDAVTITIDQQKHFEGAAIPLYLAGEGTLMLTLQVRGMLSDGPSNNKQFLAADMIAVVPPPKPKRFKVHTHPLQTRAASQPALTSIHTYAPKQVIQRE